MYGNFEVLWIFGVATFIEFLFNIYIQHNMWRINKEIVLNEENL